MSDIRLVKQKKQSASANSKKYLELESDEDLVSLSRFTSPFRSGIRGKGVINRSDDLVHPLNVALTRIQFGVEEEDSLNDLPMSLFALVQRLVVVGRLLHDQRQLVQAETDALQTLGLESGLLNALVEPLELSSDDADVRRFGSLTEERDVGT